MSAIVGSPSSPPAAGVWLKDTYEFSGVCLFLVAVLAVVANRFVQTDEPFLYEVVGVSPHEEVRRRLEPHEPVVAADHLVVGLTPALLGESDEILVVRLPRTRVATRRRGRDGTGHAADEPARTDRPAGRRVIGACAPGGGNGLSNLLTSRPSKPRGTVAARLPPLAPPSFEPGLALRLNLKSNFRLRAF